MTALRDARLQRALDHAPDTVQQPSASVRDAIHRAAHQAVRPPAAAPTAAWWTRLWKPGMPWNAAFASLLLASTVTLLWQGEEVPDATPRATSPPAAPAPAAQPPTKAEAAPQISAPVRNTEPAVAAAPQEQKRAPTPPAPAPRRSEAVVERAAPPTDEPVTRAAAAVARGEAADSARAAASGVAERELASAAPPAPVAVPVPRTARPALAAPAPVAEPPPGRSAAAAKAQGAFADSGEQRERSATAPLLPPAWTGARITQGGRQWSVARADAGALPDLLRRLVAGTPVSGNIAAADITIVLLNNGQTLGQLEVAGDTLLWNTVQGGAQRTVAARPDPALRDALRAEIARLGAAQ